MISRHQGPMKLTVSLVQIVRTHFCWCRRTKSHLQRSNQWTSLTLILAPSKVAVGRKWGNFSFSWSYKDENCKCMKPNEIYVKLFCNVFRKLFLLAPGNTSYNFYESKFLKPEWFCNPFPFYGSFILDSLSYYGIRENNTDLTIWHYILIL